jgi:hypothetical protein
MPRASQLAVAALAAALSAGCYTTKVVTSDPTATIYFDGKPLGKGRGEVIRHGLPHVAQILVKTEDGRAIRTQVRRSDPPSFKWALYSAGTCLVFCWGYPAEINVPFPPDVPPPAWDVDPSEDPWAKQVENSKWNPNRPKKKAEPAGPVAPAGAPAAAPAAK